ncbi:MAG: hypothetical protein IT238_00375 [Bacteroidia bacterium]|nr:hypothetical protein [Bacteroidia bacterium]MCZ2247899.1 DUF4340 domain-containing protein [Bacteroidia bacterium]
MKKSTKNILSILTMSVLAVVAVFLVTKYQKNTLKEELSDFAVKDTAAIDKIFLSDKDGHQLLLERKPTGLWMVNNSYEAKPDVVRTLLETIKQIQVKAPVGRASFNHVVKSLSVKSTKVEIYQHQKKVKTYYVGGATDDFMGTYMIIEGSSAPFIMYIPGFEGYLYTRYYAIPELWRSTAMYKIKSNDIKSIKMENNEHPNTSWELLQNNNVISLLDYKGEQIPLFDTLSTREYLTQFYTVHCEGYVTDIEPERKDSILSSNPKYIFTLTTLDHKSFVLKCFPKKMMVETYDIVGNLMEYDPDRIYAMMNDNKKELISLQTHTFDNILVSVDNFAPKINKFVKK